MIMRALLAVALLLRTADVWVGPPVTAVNVAVENSASVPAHILNNAQVETAAIFARAGVDLRWVIRTSPETAARQLTVIVAATADGIPQVAEETLGLAPVGRNGARGRIAYVFYDRVSRYASRSEGFIRSFDTGQLLGAVVAHELGHLLLPLGSGHSGVGIMSGKWNRSLLDSAVLDRLGFTRKEGEEIRGALAAALTIDVRPRVAGSVDTMRRQK